MKSTSPAIHLDRASRTPHGRLWALLEIGLILLVFYLQAGWPVPEVNEPHYLGKAKHYWNPSWCAGDFFLTSADAHQTFYWCFGWLTQWISLPAVAWCGRWLTWTLLACAWRRLSFLLVPLPLAAVLSASLFVTLLDRFNLAGEWVVGGVEAKGFAYALVLWGLSEFVLGRWNRVWLCFGGAAAWHVLVGGWSVLAAGIVWLWEGRRSDRTPLLKMLPGLAGGFLLALIGLVPALALTRGIDSETVEAANRIYVYERLPHHLALNVLSSTELQTRLVRSSLLLASFGLLAWLVSKATAGEQEQRAGLRRLQNFVFVTVLFALSGAIISASTIHHPALGASLLRYYWYRLYDIALPLGVSLFALRLFMLWLPTRRNLATLLLAGLIVIPGIHYALVIRHRLADRRAPADRRITDAADWIDACLWVKDNTPPTARFLTERGGSSFKWYTDRSEVVNQKDIPQDARGIVEWQTRLDDLYPEEQTAEGTKRLSLSRRSEPEINKVAEKYGAHYLLTTKGVPLDFTVKYQNNTYLVYELPATDSLK